jgi:hypothetical protein
MLTSSKKILEFALLIAGRIKRSRSYEYERRVDVLKEKFGGVT